MNLVIGLSITLVCLILEAALVVVAIRYYANRAHVVSTPSIFSTLVVVAGVLAILFLGSLAQVGIWALVFFLLGEFDAYMDAVYHSAVNFSSLGYGDIVMSEQHRLLGPLEAINGVLMIGVSTAALMATFQDAVRKTMEARHGGPAARG